MQKEKFYLLIAGGRDFFDYDFLMKKCDFLLQNHKDKDIVIVAGKARGADTLGEIYALDRGYEFIGKPPDWSIGKIGGILRNQQMADTIKKHKYHACVCFWDGISTGTKSMRDICRKDNIPYRVYNYERIPELNTTSIGFSKKGYLYCIFNNNPLTPLQKSLKIHLDRLKIFNQIIEK